MGTHESCPNSPPYPAKKGRVSKDILSIQTISKRTHSEYREIAVEEEKTRCDCLAILPYLRILLAKCKEEVVVQDGLTQAGIQSPSPIPHDTLCSIWDDVPTPTRCKKLWMYLSRRHRRAVRRMYGQATSFKRALTLALGQSDRSLPVCTACRKGMDG